MSAQEPEGPPRCSTIAETPLKTSLLLRVNHRRFRGRRALAHRLGMFGAGRPAQIRRRPAVTIAFGAEARQSAGTVAVLEQYLGGVRGALAHFSLDAVRTTRARVSSRHAEAGIIPTRRGSVTSARNARPGNPGVPAVDDDELLDEHHSASSRHWRQVRLDRVPASTAAGIQSNPHAAPVDAEAPPRSGATSDGAR